MSKGYALLLTASLVVLTACSGNNSSDTSSNTDNNDSAVAVTPVTAVSDRVHEVVSENIVQDFDEEEFDFGPADLIAVLPKGFKESKEFPGEYYYKTFPKDVSSINQIIVESDENVTLDSEDEFKEKVKAEFKESYGDNIDINVTQYDKMMIDGRPALVVMYSYIFRNEQYNILSYIIYNGTETNYVTYLEGPGADWMDEFIKSGETIKLQPIEEQ